MAGNCDQIPCHMNAPREQPPCDRNNEGHKDCQRRFQSRSDRRVLACNFSLEEDERGDADDQPLNDVPSGTTLCLPLHLPFNRAGRQRLLRVDLTGASYRPRATMHCLTETSSGIQHAMPATRKRRSPVLTSELELPALGLLEVCLENSE
jgi:hypothetical protein